VHSGSASTCGAERQPLRCCCWLPALTAVTRPWHGSSGRRWTGGRRSSAGDRRRRLGTCFAICATIRLLGTPPAARSQLPHPELSPGLTARLCAGYRGLVGARAASTASAHREQVQRQAAPGETLGSSKEGAHRHAVDAAAADLGSTGRFDSRHQPFLARLTAGWGCAQPHRRGRRGTSPEKTSRRL